MQKKDYATLYIVRHGETDWNVAKRIQGHSDIPLNQVGEQQAKKLRKIFKNIHFDAVFSSDLSRAKQTAELAMLEREIAVQTTQLLRERNFASLEGSNVDDFLKLEKLRSNLAKEQQLIHRLVPDMENDKEVISRTIQFLREVAIGYAGKTVLVVSHGGIMRTLLAHLGFTDEKHPITKIENTAYIKLRSDGVDFFIDETRGIEKD